MDKYDHKSIEKKWQDKWEEEGVYKTPDRSNSADKAYILDMFPYPSGSGLHVGHPRGYVATDIVARMKRAQGIEVLHPMGWDAFGLPAENYAIKTGVHPEKSNAKNIPRFREQLKSIGLSYDWDREICTASPEYYRWTQWLFIKLYENDLAYQKEAPVNWCPGCNTVLANEQVKEGACDRCGSKVVQKNLKQWFFRITKYADELLEELDKLDWPESIKTSQRNWIGKSDGCAIKFKVYSSKFKNTDQKSLDEIKVFTTRPDTLYGATYLVLAPEHSFVVALLEETGNSKLRTELEDYLDRTSQKTELERKAEWKEKTGVDTGLKAVHPLTDEELPIWVSDYVLTSYGTGAVMAVPAHDERDWQFATKFGLPIKEVIQKPSDEHTPYTGHGRIINSGDWDGMDSGRDRKQIIELLIKKEIGKQKIQYKLRDWLVSRQRYWGPPIPIIYCDKCGIQPVPKAELPVLLPKDIDFKPTGESPLVDSKEFHEVKCPNCSGTARREIDTLDTFVDSSWYYLRFTDPTNTSAIAAEGQIKKWMPVDLYVGGAEHAVLHLLYARFVMKALADIQNLDIREPFTTLKNQGLIRAEDGRKMSKSYGNVVNPDDVIAKFGADTLRCYEMFMGPFSDSMPWQSKSMVGVRRWLERVWKLHDKVTKDASDSKSVISAVESAVAQICGHDDKPGDIENFKFNTAIAMLMVTSNELDKESNISVKLFSRYLQLVAPFAPHLASELWEKIEAEGELDGSWPEYDPANLKQDLNDTIVVQINGKVRGTIEAPKGAEQDELVRLAQADKRISAYLQAGEFKVIVIPGRVINFVFKG